MRIGQKSRKNNIDDLRVRQLEEAYGEIYFLNNDGSRNMSKLKLRNYNNIYARHINFATSGFAPVSTDRLFESKIAKNIFKKFVKLGCIPSAEIRISALTRFGAIITDVIDSFSQSADVGRETVKTNGSNGVPLQTGIHICQNRFNRTEIVPQES